MPTFTITTESGVERTVVSQTLTPERVVGLDDDGRIVVNDYDAFNRAPRVRIFRDGTVVTEYPFLFGLSLCCDAYDKATRNGYVCRGCGNPEECGRYIARTWDGRFPGLDPRT